VERQDGGVGRVMVVTGASSGIGRAAVLALASPSDSVVLLGRNERRLRDTAARLRCETRVVPVDFAVLDEVRAAAALIHDSYERIDVLVNNAGGIRGARRTTVDGLEWTVQVNHLAGFLLCNVLLDRLRAAPDPRVITTASLAEAWGILNVDSFVPDRRSWSRWIAYGAAKQANILFTVEAARRWAPLGITATCFFPGLIRSRFASTSPLFMLGKLIPVLVGSPRRGADTLVWLATTADAVPGGYYFLRSPFAATPPATSPERARRLWTASERACGLVSG
jgi:NAD(P)-dependent dehydrogenase (short-subunit alcohol dehydrogenase family)